MAKVLVVTSGKGGVGKTTSTAALGAALGVFFAGLARTVSGAQDEATALAWGGFAAGVGKTWRMLEEAHALRRRGVHAFHRNPARTRRHQRSRHPQQCLGVDRESEG